MCKQIIVRWLIYVPNNPKPCNKIHSTTVIYLLYFTLTSLKYLGISYYVVKLLSAIHYAKKLPVLMFLENAV